MNLADLLPTSSIWTGSAAAPCPMYPPQSPALMHCVTVGATPFRLNLHVRDLGHTFMFGPTGQANRRTWASSPRSSAATQACRSTRSTRACRCTARGWHPAATQGLGCTSRWRPMIHPPGLLSAPVSRDEGDRAWAMEWIDSILALNGVNIHAGVAQRDRQRDRACTPVAARIGFGHDPG